MLKVKDIAEELGVSLKTIYRLIEEGKLRAINIAPGSKLPIYRIEEQELQDFIGRSKMDTTHEKEEQREPGRE